MALISNEVETLLSIKTIPDKVRKELYDTKMVDFETLKRIILGWREEEDIDPDEWIPF